MGTYAAKMSDFEAGLAARLMAREEEAFEELYQHFGRRILNACRRILKEEESARDALQETVLRIFKTASHFRGESRLWTWINRITVNVCPEMIRREKKHALRRAEDSREMELADQVRPNPLRQAYQAEVRNRVRNALKRLSPKHQQVVALHILAGFTISEIADRLKMPKGTVKSRIWYGRKELKCKLLPDSRIVKKLEGTVALDGPQRNGTLAPSWVF